MKKDHTALDATYLKRIRVVTVFIIRSTFKGKGKKLHGPPQGSQEFSKGFYDPELWKDYRPVSEMLTQEKSITYYS